MKKIIFFGDSGVGKTSVINRVVRPDQCFDEKRHRPTVGNDFLTRNIMIEGDEVTLQMWDNAGKEQLDTFGLTFCRGADLVVITYDVTKTASFESLSEWYNKLSSESSLRGTPFLILGNKTDIDNERVISNKRALEFAQSLGLDYAEVSAKDTKHSELESLFVNALIKAEKTKNESLELLDASSVDDGPDHFANVRTYQAILADLEEHPRIFNDNKKGVVKAKRLEDLLGVSENNVIPTLRGVLGNADHDLLKNRSKLGPFFFKAKSWFLGHRNPLLDRLCESETEWRLVEAYTEMN